jgi:hypothetical protein
MPRAKKRKHEALDDASDFPNATSAVLQEKYSDPTSQDEPAKRPRKRHIHRQSNREKYNTPERREAMKGLHENPTDPRFLPVFQGIQPGYKDGLMVRGRGAVKVVYIFTHRYLVRELTLLPHSLKIMQRSSRTTFSQSCLLKVRNTIFKFPYAHF